MIDVRDSVKDNEDYGLRKEDILRYEKTHGPLPKVILSFYLCLCVLSPSVCVCVNMHPYFAIFQRSRGPFLHSKLFSFLHRAPSL